MRSTRYRSLGGGGGAVPTIEIGPEFGDDGPVAAVTVAMDQVDAEFEAIAAQASVSLTDADGIFDPVVARARLSELRWKADWLAGASGVTDEGPQAFTNPNNASGKHNAASATRAGQVAATTTAALRLAYTDPAGPLAPITDTGEVTTAFLDFYVAQAGTALNNGGLHLEYRLTAGGAWTPLASFVADIDALTVPQSFNILAALGSGSDRWDRLNALETRVRVVLGVATNLVTCSVDAAELRFTVEKSEPL